MNISILNIEYYSVKKKKKKIEYYLHGVPIDETMMIGISECFFYKEISDYE